VCSSDLPKTPKPQNPINALTLALNNLKICIQYELAKGYGSESERPARERQESSVRKHQGCKSKHLPPLTP